MLTRVIARSVDRDPRFDGRLFGGVRTTRVYCRPICPAPMPKRENMTFYATAAAAQEAGFRPCLRCRPETAPEFAAWRGTSNTVSRALALIDRGALDEGGIDRLAERLGVGERQLRRLFRQHLGASPVSVAQTRRVLLAKQLIHETRLPMAEVALRQDSAASDASTKSSNGSLTVRHVLCGAPPLPHRPDRMAKSPSSRLSAPIRLGHDGRVPQGSRHPGRRGGLERSVCGRSRSTGCTALSRWSRPPGTRFAS